MTALDSKLENDRLADKKYTVFVVNVCSKLQKNANRKSYLT